MKKVILTIAVGVVLTSCSSGWSCKKRYCDTQKKEVVKIKLSQYTTQEVIAKP